MRARVKEFVEYALALLLLKFFGLMPRKLAHLSAIPVAWLGFHIARRPRMAALTTLELALPELDPQQRQRILRASFNNLARLLVEFSHFPELHKENISRIVLYDGLENYLEALRRGRGLIFMTAHFGAWELSSFAH